MVIFGNLPPPKPPHPAVPRLNRLGQHPVGPLQERFHLLPVTRSPTLIPQPPGFSPEDACLGKTRPVLAIEDSINLPDPLSNLLGAILTGRPPGHPPGQFSPGGCFGIKGAFGQLPYLVKSSLKVRQNHRFVVIRTGFKLPGRHHQPLGNRIGIIRGSLELGLQERDQLHLQSDRVRGVISLPHPRFRRRDGIGIRPEGPGPEADA